MIKKVIAVIILIAVLCAFLVVFGGIAIIDISIKLMWLSFSAIIAFACKSLGWNISQEIVNKLLAKQNFLPGTLTIDDNPSIKTDKIILYNLRWKDANDAERLIVHEVEVRANIYQVLLSLIRKEPLDKFLGIVQEVILKQPLFNLEYTLENKQLLTQYVERLTGEQAPVPAPPLRASRWQPGKQTLPHVHARQIPHAAPGCRREAPARGERPA